MKKLLVIAASFLLSVSAFANTGNNNDKTVQLTGFVADNNNHEALAGATVYVDGKKYYSDFDGNFSADIKPGKHQIKVELISYETIVVEAEVNQSESINIALLQLHTPMQTSSNIALR